jgi:hypothetical protein
MGKMTATDLNAVTDAMREHRLTKQQKIQQQARQLHCSKCGATAEASCDCGAAYVPAGVAAAKAIEANPEKSNNSIAKDIGVSEPTVRRARPTSSKDEVEKRVGRDGKKRRLPKQSERKQKGSIPVEQEYLDRVEKAKAAAMVPYTATVTKHVVEEARGVAKVWNELADKFEARLKALN